MQVTVYSVWREPNMEGLLDSDTPIFSAAITSQDQPLKVALSRLDVSINRILEGSEVDTYRLFVGGRGKTFRNEICPYYKANRPKTPIIHREDCRLHLINEWGATEADGCESDDLLGCAQTEDTMLIGIDKDLLMIPGKHYQWPVVRKGKVIKEGKFHTISPIEGLRHFFIQVLTGDKSDNILQWFDENTQTWKKNKWALSDKAAIKLLAPMKTEQGLYNAVYSHYETHDKLKELDTVLDLLWIWRSLGETYTIRRDAHGF